MKCAALVAAALVAAVNLHATVFELTFSGIYTMAAKAEGSIFGVPVSALPVPFTYKIIYDTALNTNTNVLLAGSTLDGRPVAQSFFGYSASGVLAADVTFGTQTWTPADIKWLNPSMTIGADLWFDTDLDVATPANCWIRFETGTANVQLGAAALMGGGVGHLGYLPGRSELWDFAESGWYEADDMTIQRVALATAPDQGSSIALLGGGLLLLAVHRRFRSRAGRG